MKLISKSNSVFKMFFAGASLALIWCAFAANVAAQENGDAAAKKQAETFEFVRESYQNLLRTNFRLMYEYTYKRRASNTNRKGKTDTWLSENYFPSRIKKKGRTQGVSVLLEKDGVPIAPEKIEKEREELAEKLDKAANQDDEKSRALEDWREKGSAFGWTWQNVRVDLAMFLSLCPLREPQPETLDGRATVRLTFAACDLSRLSKDYEDLEALDYFRRIRGYVWFDRTDKMPIKLEARALNAAPNSKPALVFQMQKVREGFWLPELINIEGIGNEAVYKDLKFNRRMEFFDYVQSQTEITDYKIGASEKQ